MDDPRIGNMYLAMVKRWFSSLYHTVWRQNLMRSGMVTGLILLLAVLGLAVAYQQHRQGNIHKLKAKISTERQDAPVPRPGGREAIVVRRTGSVQDSSPEFLSATLLPGRGMNVLQITAFVPGKGEVSLLASPTVEEAEKVLTGSHSDANGQASLSMGGAFEAPWAGRIWGSPTGDHVASQWRNHTLTLPKNEDGGSTVNGGLLLARQASSAGSTAMPDGGQAQATFDAEDFGAHWPSKTQVSVTVLLSSRSIELTITAKNTGDVAEPMGLGWRPRFALAKGGRDQVRLRIPAGVRVEMRDHNKGMPSGILLPVTGTAYDFTGREGARLGTLDLDDCFGALHQNLLDSGPVVEMTDPAGGYGIRLTALSSAIKTVRVLAPADADFISIEPRFNYPDPFGREWAKTPDTGVTVLQPGQTARWQVRMELFTPVDRGAGF